MLLPKQKLLLIVVSLIAIIIFFYAAIKTISEKKISFPKDEGRHDTPIEAWQVSMHFTDEKGRNYSFWVQYIRNDDRKLRRISFNDGEEYYSENMARNFYCSEDDLNLTCDNGFSFDKFYRLKEEFSYKIYVAFESKGKKFILAGNLSANKKPVIFAEGEAPNLSELSNFTKSLFFYSITNLDISGEIIINNEKKFIKGKAWIEHIWGEFFIPPWIKWNIQLNNSYEILLIRLFLGKNFLDICYLITPEGIKEEIHRVGIREVEHWKTIGKTYVTKWEIRAKNFDLFLNATLQDQVVIGTLSYVGSFSVSGKFFSEKVGGMSYVEEI